MNKQARLIAYYLPQYHPIPENDEWWGKGFTEWTNVALAKPQYRGHYQPRIPADLGFYDLRVPEVREAQAQMARDCGIEGFMYWHYWFGNGKQLLERPFNEVVASGKPNFPFCLGWANHSWGTRTWTAIKNTGAPKLLIKQEYPGIEDYVNHFNTLLPAFKDSRYIKVDGKLFFLIYNILDIPNPKEFMDTWQDLAQKNNLTGFHFVGNIMGIKAEINKDNILNSGVDATAFCLLNDAERKSLGTLRYLWQKAKNRYHIGGPEKYSYKSLISNIHNEYEKRDDIYPIVYPQSDRTPRAGKNAIIFTNSTPELFQQYLQKTVDNIAHKIDDHKIILLNAWNEWGEGNYVEPDLKYKHGYINAIKNVILK